MASVQVVKDELSLANSDTSADQRLIRMINDASDAIEGYCNRSFARAYVQEVYGFPGQPRLARLYLRRFPLINASCVELIETDLDPGPGAAVDTGTYFVEDLEAGSIFFSTRLPSTQLRRPDIAQDFEPGTEEETVRVSYVGGYVTQPQLDTAIGVHWATAIVYHVGDLLNPAANSGAQIWMCTTHGTSGGVEPSWDASPVKGVTTKTDGTAVWTYQGAKSTNDGRTLPFDLESAAIQMVVDAWRARGSRSDTSQERYGNASVSFGVPRVKITAQIRDALAQYAVVL